MIKVLQIAVGINGGGVGAVLLNYYRHMNHNKIHFDIIIDDIDSVKNGCLLEDEFKAMGCNIFRVTPKSLNLKKNIREVSDIMEKGNYDILHSNMEEWSALYCMLGKKYSIKTRISHAHLAFVKKSLFKNIYNRFLKIGLKCFSTDFFACSKAAGKYLFGNNIINKSNFRVVYNAIDTKSFVFNQSVRQAKRSELKIEDNEFVVGFIGRLSFQKNPERMLRIFNEICKIHNESKLIVVGDYSSYPSYSDLTAYIKNHNLNSKIKFIGLRTDIPEIMQAFDAFVLPSRYEGLGIVYVEAQAAGLMTFGTAKVVPEEVNCCKLMHFIDSEESDSYWASEIVRHSLNYERTDTSRQIAGSDFEITEESKKLENFYLSKQ